MVPWFTFARGLHRCPPRSGGPSTLCISPSFFSSVEPYTWFTFARVERRVEREGWFSTRVDLIFYIFINIYYTSTRATLIYSARILILWKKKATKRYKRGYGLQLRKVCRPTCGEVPQNDGRRDGA